MQLTGLKHIATSQTLLINEQSRARQLQGQKIFKFGFGQSPFSPPAPIVEALRQRASAHDYTPVQGTETLRAAIAKFHSHMQGINITKEQVIVGAGSKILIYGIMACFDKAEVFIPAPSWVSYAPQAELLHHRVEWIHTDVNNRWRLKPEQLARALSHARQDVQKILILNYPCNPDGQTYHAEELAALAEVLRKYQVLVIADEIYGFVTHAGQHQTLMHFYPEGTIITSGLSKWCGAGGWRLGAAIVPDSLAAFKQTLLGVASETYSCAPAPIQAAAEAAYSVNDMMANFLQHQQRILSYVGAHCAAMLKGVGVTVHEPQGGFYIFPDFSPLQDALSKSGIKDSVTLCQRILKDTGVALLPGDAFGMKPGYLSARLAYVDFDGTAALEASYRMGLDKPLADVFLLDYCPRIKEGIAALCQWLKGFSS